MEAVMSLIDDFKTPCKLMEKVRTPGGEGGTAANFLHRLAEKIGG
jgi:hypothetical protein